MAEPSTREGTRVGHANGPDEIIRRRRGNRISSDDVVSIYRHLLGREPNDEEVREALADGDIHAARARIAGSADFVRQASSWYRSHPLIVFNHVPKTGGRSFHAIAHQIYNQNLFWRSVRQRSKARFDIKTDVEKLRHVPLVGGHIIYTPSLYDSLGRPVVFLATMREPISRAVSLYNYVRSRKQHPMQEHVNSLSLRQALGKVERFRSKTCNYQLRVIFGSEGAKSAVERERVLRTERYAVGKLEHFNRFVAFIGGNFFDDPGLTIPHENSGSRGYQDDVREQRDFDEAIAMLKSENAEEIEFYNSFDEMLISVPLQNYIEERQVTRPPSETPREGKSRAVAAEEVN